MKSNHVAKGPPIYNEEERAGIRAAGKFNGQLMDFVRQHVKPEVTTKEIDRLIVSFTRDHGHTPACLGYRASPASPAYPAACCTSINEVVCHGIPNERRLKEGDIVNIDITTVVNGWHGDQSETFLIGQVGSEARKLVQATFDAMWVGIRSIKPYGYVRDIGAAIYKFARDRNFEVVRDYQCHGTGRSFHQEPGVPHFWFAKSKAGAQVIRPGMCFTIEPMLNQGTWKTVHDKGDGWTVKTLDGKLSAQFEHTILMTENGPEPTTLTEFGPQEGHKF